MCGITGYAGFDGIDPKVLKRIKEMPVSDKTKRKMLLLRKTPNPINTN